MTSGSILPKTAGEQSLELSSLPLPRSRYQWLRSKVGAGLSQVGKVALATGRVLDSTPVLGGGAIVSTTAVGVSAYFGETSALSACLPVLGFYFWRWCTHSKEESEKTEDGKGTPLAKMLHGIQATACAVGTYLPWEIHSVSGVLTWAYPELGLSLLLPLLGMQASLQLDKLQARLANSEQEERRWQILAKELAPSLEWESIKRTLREHTLGEVVTALGAAGLATSLKELENWGEVAILVQLISVFCLLQLPGKAIGRLGVDWRIYALKNEVSTLHALATRVSLFLIESPGLIVASACGLEYLQMKNAPSDFSSLLHAEKDMTFIFSAVGLASGINRNNFNVNEIFQRAEVEGQAQVKEPLTCRTFLRDNGLSLALTGASLGTGIWNSITYGGYDFTALFITFAGSYPLKKSLRQIGCTSSLDSSAIGKVIMLAGKCSQIADREQFMLLSLAPSVAFAFPQEISTLAFGANLFAGVIFGVALACYRDNLDQRKTDAKTNPHPEIARGEALTQLEHVMC